MKVLTRVLKPGTAGNWDARRVARNLPRGLDPTFVRRVFDKLLSEDEAIQTFGRTLPDAYVPIARAVLAKKTSVDAVFLTHCALAAQPDGFRKAVGALLKLGTLTTKTKASHLKAIAAEPAYVSAAQTTVAVKGVDAWLMISLLAYDGSAESADILLPLVRQALAGGGENLDFFVQMLDDRAHATPTMQPLFAALDAAHDARSAIAKVGDLAERFGGKRADFTLKISFHTHQQFRGQGKLSVSCYLFARGKPEASVFGGRWHGENSLRFDWEDGKTKTNGAKFPTLKSLDEFPDWKKAVAKKFRCTWSPAPLYFGTSLRGKARAGLLAWLVG